MPRLLEICFPLQVHVFGAHDLVMPVEGNDLNIVQFFDGVHCGDIHATSCYVLYYSWRTHEVTVAATNAVR